MSEEKLKTPEEMAQKEVNKKLAKAIAERQLEIKRYEAKIKKLQKEIKKIKDGELVPDVDEESDSSSSSEKVVERIIERTVNVPTISPYPFPNKPRKKRRSFMDYPYSFYGQNYRWK